MALKKQPTKKEVVETIKREYAKCLKDPMYFMKKYVKIQNPMKGTVNFELYPFQEDALQKMVDNRYTIILKARQMGISTLVAAYSLYLMTFFKDKNILVISINQETAKEIVTRVRYANSNLPYWLKQESQEDNRLSLRLKNGSQIKAASATANSGRSAALSLLIIDECVSGDSFIIVRNKKTNIENNIKIEDFYKIFIKDTFEVLTPSGWSSFENIQKTIKREYCCVKFTDNTEIKCSTSHKFKSVDGKYKYIVQFNVNDEIIGRNNNKTIKSIDIIDDEIELYDLINVEKNHEYYTNDLVSSNCAFIANSNEIWTSAQPALSTGGKAILLSTPNGVQNFFHRMWVNAEAHCNEFTPIKMPWYLHPDRDQSWRDRQTEQLGEKKAAQENDCDFQTTGDTALNSRIITKYENDKAMIHDPIEYRGPSRELWIWQYPMSGVQYILSADCSRGDGTDYSAFHFSNLKTMEQVAEYKGKMTTKEYGNLLVTIATEYNDAFLVVENNNVGWATVQQIIDRNYRNLYYGNNKLNVVDIEKSFTNNWDESDHRMVPGFTTTNVNRQLIINNMIILFQNYELVVHSNRLMNEFKTFIWKDGKPQAMKGHNDDLIMAYGIGLWVRNTALRMKMEQYNLNQKMLSCIKTSALRISDFTNNREYFNANNNTVESNNNLFDKYNAKSTWDMPLSPELAVQNGVIDQMNTVLGRNMQRDNIFDLKELL